METLLNQLFQRRPNKYLRKKGKKGNKRRKEERKEAREGKEKKRKKRSRLWKRKRERKKEEKRLLKRTMEIFLNQRFQRQPNKIWEKIRTSFIIKELNNEFSLNRLSCFHIPFLRSFFGSFFFCYRSSLSLFWFS